MKNFSVCFLAIFFILCSRSKATAQSIQQLKDSSDTAYEKTQFRKSLNYAWQLVEKVKADSSENSSEYAIATGMYLGMIHDAMNHKDSAEYWYHFGLDIYKKIGDTLNLNYGETLSNLGNLYREKSVYEDGIYFLKKALIVLKDADPDKVEGEGASFNNLANCYNELGEYNLAESMYLAAFNWISNKMKNTPERKQRYAVVCNNITSLYLNLGNCEKAKSFADSALQLFSGWYSPNSIPMAKIYSNRSAMYSYCGIADSCISYASLAIRIFEQNKTVKEPAYFVALNNIAEGFILKKEFDSAEYYFLHAQNMAKQNLGTSNAEFITISLNMCKFYNEQKKFKISDSLLVSIENSIQNVFGSNARQTLDACALKAFMLIRNKKYTEAGERLHSLGNTVTEVLGNNLAGLSEQEKILYINTLQSSLDLIGTVLAKSGNHNNTFVKDLFQQQLIMKRLILCQQQNLVKQLLSDSSDQNTQLVFKWKREKQLLAKEILNNSEKNKLYIDSLENSIEKTEKELSRLHPTIPKESFKQKPDISRIFHSLKKGQAAIEFIYFDVFDVKKETMYAAFVLRHADSLPLFIPLFNEQTLLSTLTKEEKESISKGNLVEKLYEYPVKKRYNLLFENLWLPLAKTLKGYTEIFYSPSGLLNSIAVHAIPISQNKFLCDNYLVHCVADISKITILDTDPGNVAKKISVWGDFNYDLYNNKNIAGGLDPIPESKTEVEQIKKMFTQKKYSCTYYNEQTATEDRFKQQAKNTEGLLHISTHGFFTSFNKNKLTNIKIQSNNRTLIHFLGELRNPLLRCGLAFSGANLAYNGYKNPVEVDDGILTGYEISQLDLHHVHLVTLSACKTGAGDIIGKEGVFGLQRAFFIAGVNKILISLWPVPDKETKELMIQFYKNLLKGQSMNEALHTARLYIRKTNPQPFYWAGFVLIE